MLPPHAPVQPMTPPCPQCRGPSTFYPAANTFGCDRCQIPIASPMAFPMQKPSNAGALALKIIGVVVLIIVIIAIKVAIRSGLR